MSQGTGSGLPNGQGADIRADVVIVGGGPAGITAAANIRLQTPDQSVVIIERQAGPKPPAGQVLLPLGSQVLAEAKALGRIETLGCHPFAGATYTWGAVDRPWAFDYVPVEHVVAKRAPGSPRLPTGMLVERSAYDDALLGYVRELGAQVINHAAVANVATVENRIAGLVLDDGRCVVGRRYLDASGPAAILARALGVGSHRVASLDHRMVSGVLGNARGLEDPAFHVRMHVRTLPYGWAWALPLSGDRLAFGVVVPAQVLDQAGSPETLAKRALADHPDIATMTNGANPLTSWRVDDATPTCAQRLVGENWLLCGGAAGISEPILMAELMLAHTTGREAGYTLAALHMGLHDAGWLLQGYADKTRRHFELHARLAQLWYAGNRQMVEHAAGMQALAASAGLMGNAQHAWSWLMQGGFTATSLVQPQVGSHDIGGARALVGMLTEGMPAPSIALQQFNVVKPNLVGAKQEYVVDFREGAVHRTPCYVRNGRVLPMIGVYERLLEALKRSTVLAEVLDDLRRTIQSVVPLANQGQALSRCIQALEAMLQDGWLIAKHDHRRPIPRWTVNTPSPIRDLGSTTRTQPQAETAPKQAIG